MRPAVKLVVIGHKDHGKSTLIGRLLYDGGFIKPDRIAELKKSSQKYGGHALNYAFLLDSFEEERRDGLTIDTVNVLFETVHQRYTLVDCPGHRELIKNMMTGASDANAALLVISAKDDEGIQDQTIDHLRLARLMGIKTLVVAVTKMDATEYSVVRYGGVVGRAKDILSETGYDAECVPFVPVSSIDGENLLNPATRMPWYPGACLCAVLDTTVLPAAPLTGRPFRLPVQDIYLVEGAPLVIGTIEAGSLALGDRVSFQPSGAQGRVIAITVADRPCRNAGPGASIGFRVESLMPGVVRRGDVCGHDSTPPSATKQIMAQLAVFGERPLENGREVRIHSAVADVAARIDDIRGTHPHISARIVLEAPLAAEMFSVCAPLGRFMVSEGNMIIAAGVITALVPCPFFR